MSGPDTRPVLFFAFANERDDRVRYLRNLPSEASGLRATLDGPRSGERWEVVERTNATLEQVLDVFQDRRYRGRIVVFHFGGHAESDELMLESPEGSGVTARASTFVTFLRQQRSLRLVFLNGCSTHGHATNLLAAGVPAVIATSRAIDDAVATRFAIRFYQGLAGGAGLRVAFEEASASQQAGNGRLRAIYRKDVDLTDARLPWDLYVRDGAAAVEEWSLGESAGDPLLGLPPLPITDLPLKPYRHLNWFGREHAPVFFGRAREIRELYERLTSPHTAPVTLLYGQSGVGKSSLLAAGLLPRLDQVSTTRYARRDRDVRLRTGLRDAVGASTSSLRDAWIETERATGRALIVLLDQVEEAFTRPHADDPTELDDFLRELGDLFLDPARRPGGKLLLGFRKEWLADIEDRLARLTIPHGKVFIDHLDTAGIVEAVSGPARIERLRAHYRLTIADGLPERVAADLLEDRGSPIAPALQLLLSKLWDRALAQAPESPRFTHDLYTELKREGVLLDDFVEQQLAALQAWQPELARAGLFLDFLAQHTTSIGSARPRSWSELESQYHHHIALLPALVARARELTLLVDAVAIDGESVSAGMTRLVHDAVAQLVRRRFEQSDLPGQQARRLLESRARAWAHGAVSDTLDDVELARVEAGASGMRSWTPDEARLVDASRTQRAHREAKVRSAAVVRALLTSKEAQDDPLVAALLLAELAGLPEPEEYVGTALRVAQQMFPSSVLEDHDQSINAVAFSPDGTLVATGAQDGIVRIWAVDGSRPCVVLGDHRDAVTSVEFSPGGELLATASLDGTAVLHRVDQSAHAQLLFGHSGIVGTCTFSPDGRRVATASTDGTARVWMCDQSTKPLLLAGHGGGVRSATFGSLGTHLVTIDGAGRARMWDLTNGSGSEIPADQPIVTAAPLPNGTFVTASSNGEIRQWAAFLDKPLHGRLLAAGNSASTTEAPTAVVCAAARRSLIGYVGGDTIIVRYLSEVGEAEWPNVESASRTHREMTIDIRGKRVRTMAFDPLGTCLIARFDDGTARVWLLPGLAEWSIPHAGSPIQAAAVSADGARAVTGDIDGMVRIWPVGHLAEPHSVVATNHFVVSIVDCTGSEVIADTLPPNAVSAVRSVETVRFPLTPLAEPTLVTRRFSEQQLSPDRTRVLVRVGRQLIVFSAAPDAPRLFVADNFTEVKSHAFTGDGARLLIETTAGALVAWNLTTGEVEWKRRSVAAWSCSADGAFVLAHSPDGVTRLLDTATGDPIWQQADVVRAEFNDDAFGTGSWIQLQLRDGATLLRQTNGSAETIRFANGAPNDESDVPTVWTSTEDGWAVHVSPGGGPVTFCSMRRPHEARVLATEIKWVHYIRERRAFLILSRNGDLHVWKTDEWGTQAPGEGHLVARHVSRVDTAPNGSRTVIQSANGTLRPLDRDLVTAGKALFVAADWAWNPDGTWLAVWSLPPMLLHAVKLEPDVQHIELGHIAAWNEYPAQNGETVGAARWLDESHIAATVIHDYVNPSLNRVIWDVHTFGAAESQRSPKPRILSGPPRELTRATFGTADDRWVYFGDGYPAAGAEALTEAPATGLTVGRVLNAPSLNRPPGSAVRCVFDSGDRLFVADSSDGAWWMSVDHLDGSRSSDLVASGRGTVERLALSDDGREIDVQLTDDTTVRVPTAAGSFTHVWPQDCLRFVHEKAVADGSAIVMLVSDGTVRVWRPDGNAPSPSFSAGGKRIRLRAPSGWAAPYPDIRIGPVTDPWIGATLDDGTGRVWRPDSASPTVPIDSRVDIDTLDASRATASVPDIVSPDGQHAVRFLRDGPHVVRLDDPGAQVIALTADTEELESLSFSADGRWLVAGVKDRGDYESWAVSVWSVDAPETPRLIHNVQLVRVHGNRMHLQGPRSSTMEIVPFEETDDPLTVPNNAIVVDDDTVAYVAPHTGASGIPRSAVHLQRVDQSHGPTVLLAPRSDVRGIRACHDHLLAWLANGEVCVWDLGWRAVANRVRAFTTARLTPDQRRRLLGESAGNV